MSGKAVKSDLRAQNQKRRMLWPGSRIRPGGSKLAKQLFLFLSRILQARMPPPYIRLEPVACAT
jgi:hypothetical protein